MYIVLVKGWNNMKKVLSFIVVLCMALSVVSVSAGAADYSLAIHNNVAVMAGNTNAIAWNTIVTLPTAPTIVDNRMLVPVRFAAEAFNGVVEWDETTQKVDITFGQEREVSMVIGSKNISVNGQIYVSDVAPQIINGSTMLPVNFLATTVLGRYVYYDDATKMAVITTRKCLSERDGDVISTIANAITSGSLPEIVIQAPVESGVSGALGGLGAETGKLSIVSVVADQEPESDNNAQCMIDGSTSTRWASQGSASAILDLGSAKPVTHIRVAVWKPTERNTNYSLEVSSNGNSYTKIFDGASSGSTYDSYDVNDTIRYIRINPNGTSAGDWASILEVEAWNGTSSTASAGTVKPVSVTVDQEPQAENGKSNVFDGDLDTRWACQGTGTLTADLGSAVTVTSIELNFWKYSERTTTYTLQVSADGASYTNIYSGSSTLGSQYDIRSVNQSVRYIRFIGNGTSEGDWTSLNEMVIRTSGSSSAVSTTTTTVGGGSEISAATGTKATIASSAITVSQEPEAENSKANLIDGSKATVWASQGEASAVFDLGSAKTLSCVGVAMKMYEDDRTIPYDIEYSADGVSYTKAWTGSSDASTDTTKYVSVSGTARYVRITAYGNTVSGWNSIAEVEIYTK
jgi:hypothetical protein